MGLTSSSVGSNVVHSDLTIQKSKSSDRIIALAGNPNVGKSTLFNALTGMNQHTGNWPGKTVTQASGKHTYKNEDYIFVDLPGTYSLMAHSLEEEVARDFICFGPSDAVIIVCDATCLERNLNLVLQTIEITPNVIVCTNLMDEAKKKKINLNLSLLEYKLGVPIVPTTARDKTCLKDILEVLNKMDPINANKEQIRITYSAPIEHAIDILVPSLKLLLPEELPTRWVALKLIDHDNALILSLSNYLGYPIEQDNEIKKLLVESWEYLKQENISPNQLRDIIVSDLIKTAENISEDVILIQTEKTNKTQHKLDKLLTSKSTGIPIMIGLLFTTLWLTIVGSNYPSRLISTVLFGIQNQLTIFFTWLGTPAWVHGVLVLGIYRTLAWVVSVMLPPMAIFFPIFTLLEDFGYLPRVAFLLDHQFKKCSACGKQALTMCMGFGCNAAGIIGCRIIDSPRERLIAIISNNFVPCNGRFPTLIAIISMFFVISSSGTMKPITSTLILLGVILLGVFMTFLVSKLLSITVLKGLPSSFTLELPSFRKPQIMKVILRSLFDRTLFVLGRAAMIAAPAGLLIWTMGNINIHHLSLLNHVANFLDPFARLLGMDGVILLAFILGFPANEIVFPIIIMAYLSTGTLTDIENLTNLKLLLVSNGWTWNTAISTMLFCLFHWPCSTTCLTIKKETGDIKWTLLSIAVPTAIGFLVCFILTSIIKIIELI